MEEREITEVLLDWNFWEREQNVGKGRNEYVERVMRFLKSNMVVSLIGVRRSGKSTIIRQVIRKLLERGEYGKEDTLIVNFEDRRFVDLNLELLDKIWDVYLQNLKPKKKPVVCLDEIHRVNGWERWVRTFHELEKGKLIISGSTSQLSRGELSSLLTGRHLDVFVFPLSFKEFLAFKELRIESELNRMARRNEIVSLLKEYLKFGGFPEVVISEDEDLKKEILQTYFEDVITKDVVERYKVRKTEKLKLLAKFYLTNISSCITFNSLEKFLKIPAETIESFSKHLEEVGMIFFLNLFHPSLKKQEKAPRKVYCIDVGLSNSIGFKISENVGKVMENLVAVELLRMKYELGREIYYWREYGKPKEKEVDFVVKEGTKIKQLVQVTYANSEDEIEDDEEKLLEAYELFKEDDPELLIITWDYEDIIEKDRKIKCIPLWKWLLE